MHEIDYDLVNRLEKELTRNYQTDKFTTLGELGVTVSKFNNIQTGKNDGVNYYLLSTSDISEDGTIILHNPQESLRDNGGTKNITKYQLHKGDIIFPQIGRFKSVGVLIDKPSIPYLGNHGLIRISCGEDRLDMAFMIKDYLQLSSVSEIILKTKITVDLIKILPIPLIDDNIFSYKDPSIRIKQCKEAILELQTELQLTENKLLLNAFQGKHSDNKEISTSVEELLTSLSSVLESFKAK